MLSHEEAEAFYDRFGARQDSQGFYEDVALDELVAHAGLERASVVLELGCGTGRFAERLLTTVLPRDARYVGLDVSRTMVELASKRLERFGSRIEIRKTDGSVDFGLEAESFDAVVATYVMDLLPEHDVRGFLDESHRVLRTGGRLAVVGLTWGTGPLTALVSGIWSLVHRVSPATVGGCRPLNVSAHLDARWHVHYRAAVSGRGIPSEVLVAEKR